MKILIFRALEASKGPKRSSDQSFTLTNASTYRSTKPEIFMFLSLSVCSQSGPPICTSLWALFRAFKAFKALKGPQIKFSHGPMHRPYASAVSRYTKPEILYLLIFPFSNKVVPQKASGGREGVVYRTSTGEHVGVGWQLFLSQTRA